MFVEVTLDKAGREAEAALELSPGEQNMRLYITLVRLAKLPLPRRKINHLLSS